MKNILVWTSIAAFPLGISVPAYASVSQDFSECDGLMKPKRSDDGMRGAASFSSYSGIERGDPSRTLAACDRAINGGKLLPDQHLRRAHILRARGVAKLKLGDSVGALSDFDTAEAAGKIYTGDIFYDRSMGVSLTLLRAIALNKTGKPAEALALAQEAEAKRPWSLDVLRAAAVFRAANAEQMASKDIWSKVARMDPKARDLAALLHAAGDLPALAAAAGAPVVVISDAPSIETILALPPIAAGKLVSDWLAPVRKAMTTAYALAASGDSKAALAWVEATRAANTASVTQSDQSLTDDNMTNHTNAAMMSMMANETEINPTAMLIDGRIAITEGRLLDAAAALNGKSLPSTPLTKEFYAAYDQARKAKVMDAPELPALSASDERGIISLEGLSETLLIAPESKRNLIDYEKSRPNILGAVVGAAFSLGTSLLGGIDRTAGFRSTPNEDGTIEVEYTGNSTSGPVVQELTLLRAAEITKESGQSHFTIVDRRDYARYVARTVNNIEMSRTLTGYKTEIDIRVLTNSDGEGDALDAVSVIDALGPLYYES